MRRIYTALRRKMYILWCKVTHFFTRNKIHVLSHNSGRQCRMYWHKSRGILPRQANGDPHQTTSEFRDHRQQNCVEKAQSAWNKRKSNTNHIYVPWFRLDRRFTDVHSENTIFSKAITHCHSCLRWPTHIQGCYGGCTSNTHPDLGLEYFCLLPKSFDFVLAVALALLLHICADFLIKLAPKVTRQMATVVRKRLLPLAIRRNATNSTLQQAQKPHQLIKRCERTFLLRQLLL